MCTHTRLLFAPVQLEPGLGESEAFYSWVITVFNVGAIVGALSGGLLLKFLPYWHMLLASLFLHTLGYVLYAVATTGWLVMLSKLLSGVFIGAEMTLALAYFGESNVNYREAIIELGKEEKKAIRVKHLLFALHSVGVNIGYIFGPGMYSNIILSLHAWLMELCLFPTCRCGCNFCSVSYQPVPLHCMVQCCHGRGHHHFADLNLQG